MGALNVSARWEGQVEAPVSGNYNFNVQTDDGVRVWFDGQQKVDDFGYYGSTPHYFSVNLSAGQRYNVKVEWKQGGGGFEARMYWDYPGQGNQIVPTCRLYPTGGGGNPCNNPPCAPTLSATNNPINAGQSTTLVASGCGGTVTWSDNLGTGNSKSVSPGSTKTYTATCEVNGCSSGNGQVTVNVNGGGGGNCSFTEGQYLTTFSATGEQVYAHFCGSAVYATTDYGVYKPQSWLQAIGYGQYACFPQEDPRPNCGGGRIGVAEEVTTEKNELTISPNPNDGEFEARFYVEPGRKATLRVSDVLGRQVWQKSLTGQGEHREMVRLPAQSVGSYILLLDKEATAASGKTEFKRVIVVK